MYPGKAFNFARAQVASAAPPWSKKTMETAHNKTGTQLALVPVLIGGPCKIRTYDQLIKSQLLYQLS
jgi:hypothetical protein